MISLYNDFFFSVYCAIYKIKEKRLLEVYLELFKCIFFVEFLVYLRICIIVEKKT